MKNFEENRNGKGTKEWSDYSYNICQGCEHGCLYCYAKAMRSRFNKSLRVPGAWEVQRLNPNQSRLGAEVGAKGVVMFPTTHDITPAFLPECLTTIRNLLGKNRVLIVSKPHLAVVKTLCRELADRKSDIMFRFSIGTLDESICAFWEPGAPIPQERIAALKFAFEHGFSTSVSMEPMLTDRQGICDLVAAVDPFVTGDIWIGKMNSIPRKTNAHIEGFDEAAAKIKAQQTDQEILKLVDALAGHRNIKWKDSIKKVLAKHGRAASADVLVKAA